MRRTALVFVVALGALHESCETKDTAAGVEGPCTRDSDCVEGLLCQQGVCTTPDIPVSGDGEVVRDSDVGDGPAGQ